MHQGLWAMLMVGSPTAQANGQTTHLWISDTAITHIETPELRDLVLEHRGHLRMGTMFPDGGYAVGHEYGEHAHWEPFQDQYRDWIVAQFDDPIGVEAAPHVAFYLGLASHGMADQVFDSMYMERSKVYDGDFGWQDAAKSLDTSQDVVFADLVGAQSAPQTQLPDILPDLFAASGIDVAMETLEDGQGWLEVAVDGVSGMSEVSTLVDDHLASFPWGCSHLLDPAVPGAPPFEARVVAAYWESLWADLQGTPLPLTVIGSWPSDGARLLGTEATDVESRISVVFNRSLFQSEVTASAFEVTSDVGAHSLVSDLFYGNDSHVVNIAPESGWAIDSDHRFQATGLVGTDGRRMEDSFRISFTTKEPAEADHSASPATDEAGCNCTTVRSPSGAWFGIVAGLLMLRRRR